MTRYVVDASVAVKWFLPEQQSLEAARLQDPEHQLLAPDFLVVEAASVMLKRLRGGELALDDAHAAISLLPAMMRLRPSAPLIAHAIELAVRYGRSVYDALYVALALRDGCPLVTADQRLFNALRPHLPGTMMWVEDLPEPA